MFLDTQNDPEFTQPTRQIFVMLAVMVLVLVAGVFLYPTISPIFLASPWLNGFILAVFVIGVLACFWQMRTLITSVYWIEGFASDRPGHEFVKAPRILASLAALLSDSRSRKALSSGSSRSILDSVATRLDEARDITRYIVNLLIFLGLLGTFYGLATTVPAVVETIRSLAPQEGQTSLQAFDNLMTGLEKQMGGMGTAFASSLLGLAGSLIVGLLEIFAGHGQNRFYMELEEWLSSITRVGIADSDSGGTYNSALNAVVEQTNDQIDSLTGIISKGEELRAQTDNRLSSLSENIALLTKQFANNAGSGQSVSDPAVFNQIAQSQDKMAVQQGRLAEALTQFQQSVDDSADAETRMRLRNIDVQLLRLLEEMSAGRQDSIAEIRQDLAMLTKTLQRVIDQNER